MSGRPPRQSRARRAYTPHHSDNEPLPAPNNTLKISPLAYYQQLQSMTLSRRWQDLVDMIRLLPSECGTEGSHVLWHVQQGHVLEGLSHALSEYVAAGHTLGSNYPFEFNGIKLKSMLYVRRSEATDNEKKKMDMRHVDEVERFDCVLIFDQPIGNLSVAMHTQEDSYIAHRAGDVPAIFANTREITQSNYLKFVYCTGWLPDDQGMATFVVKTFTAYAIMPHSPPGRTLGYTVIKVVNAWETRRQVEDNLRNELLTVIGENQQRYTSTQVPAMMPCI